MNSNTQTRGYWNRSDAARVLENLKALKPHSNSILFDVIHSDRTRHFKDSELTNQQGWTKSNTNTPAYEAAVGVGGVESIAWLVGGQAEVYGREGKWEERHERLIPDYLSNHVTRPVPLRRV